MHSMKRKVRLHRIPRVRAPAQEFLLRTEHKAKEQLVQVEASVTETSGPPDVLKIL